jgi:hypothetical protein
MIPRYGRLYRRNLLFAAEISGKPAQTEGLWPAKKKKKVGKPARRWFVGPKATAGGSDQGCSLPPPRVNSLLAGRTCPFPPSHPPSSTATHTLHLYHQLTSVCISIALPDPWPVSRILSLHDSLRQLVASLLLELRARPEVRNLVALQRVRIPHTSAGRRRAAPPCPASCILFADGISRKDLTRCALSSAHSTAHRTAERRPSKSPQYSSYKPYVFS